jgi:hypothetical protein
MACDNTGCAGVGGCVTQKIDWSARVGNYTYAQAVMELGPPDKSAKLTDGTVVATGLRIMPKPSSRRNLTLRRPAVILARSRPGAPKLACPPDICG